GAGTLFEVCRPGERDNRVAGVQATLAKPARLPGAAQAALSALREALRTHGEPLPETSTIPPGIVAVELTRWREQFRIRYGSDERSGQALRRAFQRGREHLLRENLIAMSDPYVWTT